MVVAIFGESCTGKSTLAKLLKTELSAEVFSGRDYLRLSKNEAEAKKRFADMLKEAGGPLVYVVSEKEQLALLPDNCLRVLVTADISLIEERFAKRMGGKLPPQVAAMLEQKHGMFDGEPCDLRIESGVMGPKTACGRVLRAYQERFG